MTEHTIHSLKAVPGMPPRAPLDMPVQDLKVAPQRNPVRTPPRVLLARLIAFGGAALVTGYGIHEMIQVVSIGGVTLLEGIMTALFAVTFAWIALAATSALAGILAPPARHVRVPRPGEKLTTRTALVMPIYHEDPVRTTAALAVMARGLAEYGEAQAFEIVVLSDSTSADAWIQETLAMDRLKASLQGIMPVWYRRRWQNGAKKAGNVKDFVEQWGGRYEHFIVLDADSLMAPETLLALTAGMEADPDLGILQTVPVLACGRTLFGRLQQFAGRIYGPIMARGLAAWQGSDGNYWGHNAIIRTDAFAAACGLPDLSGKKPFGGPILSHDFVEAALIRRAGWRVEMASRLGGSWEESPPSLIDTAIRDRRWAQGNLQHSKVITARGLTGASRMHLAIGIMSYLASPLWLLLIGFGFVLTLQARLIRPEYFSEGFQLFPTWPHFDSERMIQLFVFTMGVLLLPKFLGLARALLLPELRRSCGGAARLIAGSIAEILISALYAPVMMAIHSRQIYEIVLGRDAGWSAQRRDAEGTSWGDAFRRHRWHMAFGFAMALAAGLLSPAILAWLAPTVAGLILAIPLSKASGSTAIGLRLRDWGILVTPEELEPHPAFREREAYEAAAPALPTDAIAALAADETLRARHYSWTAPAPRRRGSPDPAQLTAAEKIRDATSVTEALGWLEPRERLHLAGNRSIMDALLRLPHDGPGTGIAKPAPAGLWEGAPEPEQIRTPAA